jgi:hypothetical protein
MWLIEGIRLRGKHPSNNPMVMPEGPVKGNYEKISQGCHADAVKAYRAWWEKAAQLPREKAVQLEPFKGAKLRWY